MWDVLVIHNFSELKNLAYNAKIRSLLKFLLIRYVVTAFIADFRTASLGSHFQNANSRFCSVTIGAHLVLFFNSDLIFLT